MMKMNKRILMSFIAFVALFATTASAYVLLSPRRAWDSVPTVIVDSRGSSTVINVSGRGRTQVRNAIRSSAAWNGSGAGTVVRASIGNVRGSRFRLGDNIPMLNFRDPIGACNGSCLAATFTGFFSSRPGTDRINDADIVTNPNVNYSVPGDTCSGSEFRLEGVMVHEVGHLLGLGHTGVGGATMFPSVSPCNNGPASTASDDEAAIRDLY